MTHTGQTSPDEENPREKIIFLNQLRGLAALLVVCAHYLNNFWFRQSAVATVIHTSPLDNIAPPFLAEIFSAIPFVKFGEFGVALFFLISGFVIPLSLEKYGSTPFLLSRFFRIWPTYIAGLAITVMFLFIVSTTLGRAFPFEVEQVIVQAVIVLRDWLWYPNIDGIVWTLEIEVKFYVLMAVYFAVFKSFQARTIVLFTLIICLVLISSTLLKDYIFTQIKPLFYILNVVTFNMALISFMLCGTLFYLIHSERLSIRRGIVYLAVLLGCFAITWSAGLYVSGSYAIPQYFYAFGLFSLCFYFKDWFRHSRLLDYLAMISYPLYVVHALTGYAIMYLLIKSGFGEATSLLAAFVSAFALATAIHYVVERPSQQQGRKLAKRILNNTPLASRRT